MGVKTRKLSNTDGALIQWQSVFVGDGSTGLTAEAGKGYLVDTTSGTVEVTLPSTVSSTVGDRIDIKDFARTFNSNNLTLASNLFDGVHNNATFETNGQTISLVYSGSSKGWTLINEDTTTHLGKTHIEATGGTITTSGDYKIHTFTGDGCFVVSQIGNPAGGPNVVSYVVVAGGGGNPGRASGTGIGGGAGAGGFREGKCSSDPYTDSPLDAGSGITVTATTFPITVGGGGSGGSGPPSPAQGTNGSNSVFSTITSAGGGRGGRNDPDKPGAAGGSGGGGINGGTGGAGNTPPVSPPQGNTGGTGTSPTHAAGGGGGGAGGTGQNGDPSATGGGNGGAGVTTHIPGSPTTLAGGGAGGRAKGGGAPNTATTSGGGGAGGSGPAPSPTAATAGTANTGGGAGGDTDNDYAGKAGGKGIVILRYKFQN